MSALAALSLFLVISSGLSHSRNDGIVMNIPDVSLVRPKEGERNEHPMFNKDLEMGDIVPVFGPLKEESRQVVNFTRYKLNKWPNREIPLDIIPEGYTSSQLDTIVEGINTFNKLIKCMQIVPRSKQEALISLFSGNGATLNISSLGCWSYISKIGGRQAMSLQSDGCVSIGTFLHEMLHAIGFAHEQNRGDRDKYIDMKWENIPEEWRSQYKITNDDFIDIFDYDYMSIMHYPVYAPGTNKYAFTVKVKGVDESLIGKGNNLTETDIAQVNEVYCKTA